MDTSPSHSLDWDEEPLFADDINSEDDDPPPLPPPMPTLSQLSQPHNRSAVTGGRGRMGSGDRGDEWNNPRGAATAGGGRGSTDQTTPTQKKRAPILTLTTDRIFSEKGLPRIEKEFPKLKFKGKGHEASDVRYLLQQYELWANSMYPKLTFKDVTDRIERLAKTKEFKTQLVHMRRRWARGPTPPIQHDEDDDVTTENHHDNSDNHHRSDSPTHQQSVVETSEAIAPASRSDCQTNASENRPSFSNSEVESDSDNDRERQDRSDLDDLLMRESDILNEREMMSRKRLRDDSDSSCQEEQGTPSNLESGHQPITHTGEQAKRSKVSCDREDEMESLLAEEELMLKACEDDCIPPGFEF